MSIFLIVERTGGGSPAYFRLETVNAASTGRWALWLSFPLALLLAISSVPGIFLPSVVYANENRLYTSGAVGADLVNLVVVAPLLMVTAILALRGWMGARLLWTSTVLYVVYAFIYYTLDVRFNHLFWAYCAVQGLSFYVLVGALPSLSIPEIARRYSSRTPAVATAILFLIIAAGAAIHWVQETGPAVLSGAAPQDIRESGHLTDVPAVLDIAFVLPALTIAAVLLLRRRPLGFVLGPVLLAFTGLLALLIMSIPAVLAWHGHGTGYGAFVNSGVVAAAAAVLLPLSLRSGANET
jgi:hypothetical protein